MSFPILIVASLNLRNQNFESNSENVIRHRWWNKSRSGRLHRNQFACSQYCQQSFSGNNSFSINSCDKNRINRCRGWQLPQPTIKLSCSSEHPYVAHSRAQLLKSNVVIRRLTQTYISIITSNLAAPQELMKPGLKRLTCLQSSSSILQVHKSHNPHALRTF